MIKRAKNDAQAGPEAEAMRLIADVESRLGGLRELHERQRRSEAELADKERRLSQTNDEVKHLREEIAKRESELEQERQELAEREQQMVAQIEAFQQREREFAERESAVNTRLEELSRRESELVDRESGAGELQAQIDDLGERGRELDVREQSISERQRELDERAASLEASVAERQQQLEAWAQEQQQKLAEREQELEQRLTEGEHELEERRRAVESASEQAVETGVDRNNEIQRLTQRLQEAEQLAAERGEEVLRNQNAASELAHRLEQLRVQLDDAQSGSEQSSVQECTDRESELEARLAEVMAELDRARAEASEPRAPEELHVELEQARSQAAEAETLRGQLEDLQRQASVMRSEFESRLAAAASGGAVESREASGGTDLATRRRRLRDVRRVIKAREAKISRAVEVLRERQKECETVLANKGLLEKQLKEVEQKRAKIQSASARNKSGAFMLYLTVSTAIMAALSWAISGHVTPGTYLATATLAAQNLDREPEPFELEEWQAAHEALLTDQQFLTMASERMARRGLTTLGQPTLLKTKVESDVTHRSAKPGELTIEYRGDGRSRTELELNTYVTALRSYAEASKSQRQDGASTIIVNEASAKSEPIDDARPMYAGGIFGGSMLLVFGVGGLIWKRLAADRERFEADTMASEASADMEWIEPELTGRPPRG